jgi:hypothetical protein
VTGLVLPGAVGDYASTPNDPSLHILGDIDVRVAATATDWTPATAQYLVAKFASVGNQRSWRLLVQPAGTVSFGWSVDGIADILRTSTVPATIPASGRLVVRATVDVDDGGQHTVTFYTGPTLSGPWTLVGAPVTNAGTTSIFASTSPVEVGSVAGGTANFAGSIHAVQVRNGIDGTVLYYPDFEAQGTGTTAFVDTVGRVWTKQGNASIVAGPFQPPPPPPGDPYGLILPGAAGDYASTPYVAALGITGNLDVRVLAYHDNWHETVPRALAGRYHPTGDQRSWLLHRGGDARLRLGWSTDGTNGTVVTRVASAPFPVVAGWLALRATVDVDNGAGGNTVRFYTGPSLTGPWKPLGAPQTGAGTSTIFNSLTAPLEVGAFSGGQLDRWAGAVAAVQVRNLIGGTVVADPDFAGQPSGTTSFTDAPGRVWTVHGAAAVLAAPPAEPAPTQPVASPPAAPRRGLPPLAGQRSASFRFWLIDGPTGIHKGQIHPLADSTPTLSHDTTRTIARAVDLALDAATTAQVDTVRDRVRVEMLLAGQSWPLGTYVFVNNPRQVVSPGRRESSPALMDLMWPIDQQLHTGFAVQESPHRKAGVTELRETAEAALRRLLAPFGVEPDMEPSVFTSAGAWAPGARRGQVIEALALVGDWFSPWFDHHGRLRFVRSFDPAARLPDFDWDANPAVLRDTAITESDDLLAAPNRWVVVSNNSGDEASMAAPVVGVYNLPDEAPHSAANRGAVVADVVELQIASAQQANAVAANLGQRQTLFEQVELATTLDPRHDAYNVIAWDGRVWLEVSWSMQLTAGGEMRHVLRRAYPGGVGGG